MIEVTIPFSGKSRNALLAQMAGTDEPLDVLVIGGGITGAGIALDAAARGMRVGLAEMQDFAAGTSSRSTKLVHGGLRYLKQLEIGVVAEVGRERAIVYENGPHVTTPERMLLPIYRGGTFGRFGTSLGLRVYDFLAGVKRGERRRMLPAAEVLAKEPLLKQGGLLGGGYYVEYRTDDARLTIEALKEAAARGALAVNYAKVTGFRYEDARLSGAEVTDLLSGRSYELRARKIVNAAGPWVDALREMDRSKQGKMLELTQGVHLVIDQGRFPLRQAVYFDTPDGRMVFAIPREGKTYVGTTDTVYRGDIAHPRMTAADRTYILGAINGMFPGLAITEADVESSWAGVRPLIYEEGKSPSEISRRDEIWESASGLITIAGGKLTGYRKMAETVVDRVAAKLKQELGLSFAACSTRTLPISGGKVGGAAALPGFVARKAQEAAESGLPRELAAKWAKKYGSNADRLIEISLEAKGWVPAARIGSGPDRAAEDRNDCGGSGGVSFAVAQSLPVEVSAPLRYALEAEMAMTPVDFFVRRTGALLFDIAWVRRWKEPVIAAMARYFGWSEEEKGRYADELERALVEAVVPTDADQADGINPDGVKRGR
ncbi:glycerol-3-phosphate dehydrogenase/oxidase [Paenibacillus macerans]|uniref:glycerol-3-phosphate dehydrogenase/oxidase n=1 Tax=Paenibacillus macerans TaxID=44252 RepID=UPI003D317302